jgi:fermentation-respiration switch protein FrsA (DUF1100 family)
MAYLDSWGRVRTLLCCRIQVPGIALTPYRSHPGLVHAPLHTVARVSCPVMLVHGIGDTTVPVAGALQLQRAARAGMTTPSRTEKPPSRC